jgi:hypothetical protein
MLSYYDRNDSHKLTWNAMRKERSGEENAVRIEEKVQNPLEEINLQEKRFKEETERHKKVELMKVRELQRQIELQKEIEFKKEEEKVREKEREKDEIAIKHFKNIQNQLIRRIFNKLHKYKCIKVAYFVIF